MHFNAREHMHIQSMHATTDATYVDIRRHISVSPGNSLNPTSVSPISRMGVYVQLCAYICTSVHLYANHKHAYVKVGLHMCAYMNVCMLECMSMHFNAEAHTHVYMLEE